MKQVQTQVALIIDGERIEAGQVLSVDDAKYAELSAWVTVIGEEVSAPVAEAEVMTDAQAEAQAESAKTTKAKKA